MLLTIISISIIASLIAYVYKGILSYEILNPWFMFGMRFEKYFFYKPIWGCMICISGQLALWGYLVNCFYEVILSKFPFLRPFLEIIIYRQGNITFNAVEMIYCVFLSIFYTFLLNRLINKL